MAMATSTCSSWAAAATRCCANDGEGHFEDVTRAAGLDFQRPDGGAGEARQPLIADLDNDGRQDLLITYANDRHRVYRNLGDGRFEDVSERAGLGGAGLVGGPATVFDFDGDGLLDVYLGYFGDYLHGAIPTFERDNRNALPNRLFRNLGGLRFRDVTGGSGTGDAGWTQAVSHADLDGDGRQDLIVANDYGRNALLRNLGEGRFRNVAPELGVDTAFHSMNVGVADLNADAHPDIYVSNIATLVKDDKYAFPDVDTPLHFDLRAMAGMLVKESDVLWLSSVVDGRLDAYLPSIDVERGETSTGWAWDAEFFDFRPRRRRGSLSRQRHQRLQHLLDGVSPLRRGWGKLGVPARPQARVERLLRERGGKAPERLAAQRRRSREQLPQHRLPGRGRRRRPRHRHQRLPRAGSPAAQRRAQARTPLPGAAPGG